MSKKFLALSLLICAISSPASADSAPLSSRDLRSALEISMVLFTQKWGNWMRPNVTGVQVTSLGDEVEVKIHFYYGGNRKNRFFCHYHTPERFDCHQSVLDR